ncbi:MAG: hypothetical protein QOJ06_148 [Pseudonocardiales bacterium]|jgi:hypothetical protein|nr:hypothetical protein [Pseudonocardiales bacterium]
MTRVVIIEDEEDYSNHPAPCRLSRPLLQDPYLASLTLTNVGLVGIARELSSSWSRSGTSTQC